MFYKSIIDALDELKLNFVKECKAIIDDEELPISDDILDMMKTLIFGITASSDIKKMDDNKNRNLVKQALFNIKNFDGVYRLLKTILENIEVAITYASDTYYKYMNEFKETYKLSSIEVEKMDTMLSMYSSICFSMRGSLQIFKKLIRTSGFICEGNMENIYGKYRPEIKHFKKESLKRYYFNDLYELKNNIKYFEKDVMIFGETNTIMKQWNIITDFLLKDFKFMYIVIHTNLEY